MQSVNFRGTRSPRAIRRPATNCASVQSDPLQHSGVDQLFIHARDALVVADLRTGRILRWNPAAERMFGYTHDEAVGKPIEMLMPPATTRLFRECTGHYLRTGDATLLSDRAPLGASVRTQLGEEVSAELTIAALEGPSASSRWILITLRAVTPKPSVVPRELDAAREQLARVEAQAQLARYEALLRESTAELAPRAARTRRSAARLARATTADSQLQTPRLKLLAQVVEIRSDELRRRLAEVADATAIETGKFELEHERVNLVPLLGRIVAETRARSACHRLNLATPQGLTATCDRRRIEKLVQDLIDGAIRRNPRGCWIDVDLRRPLVGMAQIEVRDYGRPPTTREREQLANPQASERGWAIDRHVIERHGGSLDVQFPHEGGVRVAVTLPTNHSRRG